jgi:hypothetical protein
LSQIGLDVPALLHGAPRGRPRKVCTNPECRVEHDARQGNSRWLSTDHLDLDDRLPLYSVNCTLPLGEIHDPRSGS